MNDPFLPEELRIFVACEIPDEWKQALGQAGRALSKSGLSRLRWVRPEGIHLTLKFLGDVGRHLLPDIHGAMLAAGAARTPFELHLRGLGSFGGRGRIRVVWAGIEGDLAALRALQARMDDELDALGFARETRPFSPHLTLARVPENAAADIGVQVASALRQVGLPEPAPFTVEKLSLMRSQLGPGGASYTQLATAPLRRGSDVR